MQISDQLAEALARFAYVHAHRAEVTEADRTKAAAELAERIHQDGLSGDMRNSPLDDMKKGPPIDTER
jgi:hypothetical protein